MKHQGRFAALRAKSRRGFRGYPVATVAYYGPNADRASKVAVGVISGEGREADPLERWHSEDADARFDPEIPESVLEFIPAHKPKSVVMSPGIIGGPLEEGKDYPEREACPACPYWAGREGRGNPLKGMPTNAPAAAPLATGRAR